ncbi:hypothetical protein [Nonomuraea turcica]|uniref:hypothetical protein n=1 Tax=Nonomuraea sp. G32 TaxID=3067274 RepID=UPI00273BE48C|nr:hypothetical protein [Nonomuraea sp. G32]MDP4509350.1 hypothetical protein [Nonomuraea sp. G32]
MDELRLLKDYRDSLPPPSDLVMAQAQRRLTAEMEAAATLSANRHQRPRLGRQFPDGRPHRLWSAKFMVTGGVAATAILVIVAFAALDVLQARTAYAVERRPDGTLAIHIREPTEPQGLEDKLLTLGVNASITYASHPGRCTNEPRGRMAEQQPEVIEHPWAHDPNPTTRFGEWVFILHPDRIQPGQTLIWNIVFDENSLLSEEEYAKVHEQQRQQQGWRRAQSVSMSNYLIDGSAQPCAWVDYPAHTPTPLRS